MLPRVSNSRVLPLTSANTMVSCSLIGMKFSRKRRTQGAGPALVIPAKAGIHLDLVFVKKKEKRKMDSGFRWNDEQKRLRQRLRRSHDVRLAR